MKPVVRPHLGMRTVKTAICVAICLFADQIFFDTFTLYSSVAAIVCLQSSIENTVKTGLSRLIGTAIGGCAGLAVLPLLAADEYIYLGVIAPCVIGVIYLCNFLRRPGASTISAIVFMSIALVPKQGADPYEEAFYCILETVIGIVVATVINRAICPARLKEQRIYSKTAGFDMLKKALSDKLLGDEALLLFEEFDEKARKGRGKAKGLSVRLPVPLEYVEKPHINAAFIDTELRITRLELSPDDGYIVVPAAFMPCTVVWQEKLSSK